METIDLVATATQILELLSDQGISGKSLHAYTHTGIGCVIRHFQAKGILCAAPEMLDAFLLEQREFFDQGAFSVWKWRLLRRGCELLKHCAEKGSVDLPPLSPWMPALRRPRQSIWKDTPTPEQLADLDNIYALVWRTNSAMLELGLTDATVGHYRNEGLAIILNRHYESGTDRFSGEILDQIVADKRIQYEYGQIGRGSYQNLRKAAYWIQEMHQTGHITLAKVPNWGQREPVEPFNSLLREFCTHTKQSESMAETTRNVVRSAIRRFLFEMEDHGFRSLADFTLINVNGCVTSFAAHYAGGLGSAIFSVQLFLRFLFERNLTITDLSQSLPELMATRKMFHEGFTEDELEYLLEHPDRTTAIGKRDYAMMVLAAQSGLRACDVVRLELGSIDWRAREIRLVQHKTGEPLSLPLEAESGNAIADYILNGRPDSALPNIFLCHTGVIRPLDARSASGVVSKHMKLAGIPAKRRAFHALRRTFGTRLLQNEVSFELIQQLLGHRDMDSMKLYLSIDEQGLKQCALPLLSHRKAGGAEMTYTFESCFAARIEDFIAQKNALGFGYLESSRLLRDFDRFCMTHFPEENFLTEELCLAWATKKNTEGNNTFRNRMMPVREFARYLNRNGEAAYVLPPDIARKDAPYAPYIYTEDDILTIWDVFDHLKPRGGFPVRQYVIPAMVKLMYCCGLRPAEARKLRVSDVDLEIGRLNIMESKKHRSRIVMMAEDVTQMLSDCSAIVASVMPEREPFFPNSEGGFYGKRGLEKTFRQVLKKAAITGTGRRSPRLYDFRHTFATHRLYRWMREGKDLNAMLPYLSAYMGHAQLSDTYYYIHLVPGLLEEMSGFAFSSAEAFLPEVRADE